MNRSPSLVSSFLAALVAAAVVVPVAAAEAADSKRAVVASIDAHRDELIDLSSKIWLYAETALREKRSAELLADYAESEGFAVERGVAGMPTAFVADFGEGRPVIGIMGEYDALPGISQKAQPEKEPLEPGAAGHGCGHNLFGAASLGAAVAIKESIEAGDLAGTVRFYGTPAEEAVGGKLYMVREGLFDDVDVALVWHPSDDIRSDTESSQAMVDFVVEFRGHTAHAAFDPWNGRSALDALEIFTFALNQMREHVRPTVRMHYAIIEGGDVPNVVPEKARLWCWLRDSKHTSVDRLLERARKIADGAAMAAGVEVELRVQSGDWERLVNMTGQRILHRNLEWLGPLEFSAEEQQFARAIQRATGVEESGLRGGIEPLDDNPGEPEGGSTDVADVSWRVPTLQLYVTTAPADTPWHAWPVVAAGGMSIGHKGMLYAAKALAATMVDLFEDAAARAAIRREFEEQTAGLVYRGYIPDGPPPIPAD
jgi:aminobenzoyl-glutamate utilization protein B